MIRYGRGYYNDEWAGKSVGGKTGKNDSARHYAALMERVPYIPTVEAEADDDSAEVDDQDIEPRFPSLKKVAKPRYFAYDMTSRKPYYEINQGKPRSPYEYPKHSTSFGYEAFRARYGEDSPVPAPARPASTPAVTERQAQQVKAQRPEKIVKFTQDDYVEPETAPSVGIQEPTRIRLLSVSPEPDLPEREAVILQAEDPKVLERRSRRRARIASTLFPNDVYPQNGRATWLSY